MSDLDSSFHEPTLVIERLENIRKHLNISVSDFASSIGYSEGYYRQVKNGKFFPSGKLVNLVVKHYGANVAYLNTGNGEMFCSDNEKNDDLLKVLDYAEIGARVSEIRKRKELSLKSVALMSGSTPETIRQVEGGAHKVSERILKSVAKALDISYDWLLYGVEKCSENSLSDDMISYLNSHPKKRKIVESWMKEEP